MRRIVFEEPHILSMEDLLEVIWAQVPCCRNLQAEAGQVGTKTPIPFEP